MMTNVMRTAAFALLGSEVMCNKRMAAIRRSDVAVVLNIHRVGPDDGSAYKPLSPKIFDELLSFVKKRFSLVTFASLGEQVSKPRLIVSFDDGYKDFIDIAAPILQRHGIKCNHNVIPGCIESGLPPLNVIAQDFVGRAPKSLVRSLEIPGFDSCDLRNVGARLSRFIKNRSAEEQEVLRENLLPQFYAWGEFYPTAMMNRDDIRQISLDHELGGHSFSHASMEFQSDEYLRRDVELCQQYFKNVLGQTMQIYAFPNGSCREGQEVLVKEAGVEHVLLVGEEFDTSSRTHKRFTFDARGHREARFKALGGFARIPQ